MSNSTVQSIALDFQKKTKEKKMKKRFDSAEDIAKDVKEKNLSIENLYIGYIDAMSTYLASHSGKINGAPVVDFFIQGLITISINPDAFKSTLENYLKFWDCID